MRSNIDEAASVLPFREYYYTVEQSVDGVVLAHAHVLTRVVHCATLTLDDVAGFAILTAENLNSESFAFRLTTVLRTTYTFLMCHFFKILGVMQ